MGDCGAHKAQEADALRERVAKLEASITEPAEDRLRKALTEVRLGPAYELAVEKGIREGRAMFPDSRPDDQLRHARRVALGELAERIGWDMT